MFTGIVQHRGRVEARTETPHGQRLRIDAREWDHHPEPGASIAVDGCCLTIAEPRPDGILEFDVITQTLHVTRLGDLDIGSRVNLEAGATPSTRLDGHIVQGHVDALGIVDSIQDDPEDWRLTVRAPDEGAIFLAERGSIAINGVSLTLAAVRDSLATVALIPTTLERTNLETLRQGDRVNLEYDYLARMVVHALRTSGHIPTASAG